MDNFSRYFSIFIFFGILFLYSSCATSGIDRSSSDVDQLLIENPELTLKDYLRRIPGVHVTERGGEVRVVLRGITSISGNNSPLFVVDGTQIGTSYRDLENAVNIRDVESIRVMRSSESMTTYGMRAANGAIVVYTKQR